MFSEKSTYEVGNLTQKVLILIFFTFFITFFVKSLEVSLYFTTFAASYPRRFIKQDNVDTRWRDFAIAEIDLRVVGGHYFNVKASLTLCQ